MYDKQHKDIATGFHHTHKTTEINMYDIQHKDIACFCPTHKATGIRPTHIRQLVFSTFIRQQRLICMTNNIKTLLVLHHTYFEWKSFCQSVCDLFNFTRW